MNPTGSIDFQAIREALRRRMTGMNSNAGISPGSPVPPGPANMPNPNTNPPAPNIPGQQSPVQNDATALGKQQPGEAELIIKALTRRLEKLGETQPQGA